MKTTTPGFHHSPIVFSEYPSNTKIYIVTAIPYYLEITKELQTIDQLIMTYKKPQKAVTTRTITRWCKVILEKAGTDIEKIIHHPQQDQAPQVGQILRGCH